MNPTMREMLDPWMTRLYTSRPYWSVPIGWTRSGARSAAAMSILVGLCGATRFWPSATSARAAMMADPTTAPLCRRTRGARRAQGAAPARAGEGRATSAMAVHHPYGNDARLETCDGNATAEMRRAYP